VRVRIGGGIYVSNSGVCALAQGMPDALAQVSSYLIRTCATHCNALQHTATHSALHWRKSRLLSSEHALSPKLIDLDTLQHTATHCNTLQYTATHCNTLCTALAQGMPEVWRRRVPC